MEWGFSLLETSRHSLVFLIGFCLNMSTAPIKWDLETCPVRGDMCPPPGLIWIYCSDVTLDGTGLHEGRAGCQRGCWWTCFTPFGNCFYCHSTQLLGSGTRNGDRGSKQKHSCGSRGHEINMVEEPYEGSRKNKQTHTWWKMSLSHSTPLEL